MKKVFVSLDYYTDKEQAERIRGLNKNPNIEVSFYDYSVIKDSINENKKYIKNRLNEKIRNVDSLVFLVGKNTKESDWVDWQIKKADQLEKRVIFMRFKDDKESSLDPDQLKGRQVWDFDEDVLESI